MSLQFNRLLITCEHGGNKVPLRWASHFAGAEDVLESHRGWDPGALPLAERLALDLGAPLIAAETTRLLVELNRSLNHPALFSDFTAPLDEVDQARILAGHYFPYRNRVEATLGAWLAEGERVLHLSVHTFTPTLHGQVREAEIGLLFDPRREVEARFCAYWQDAVRSAAPQWRVRRNYPYRGTADGFTTALRRKHRDEPYAGIELEVVNTLATSSADKRCLSSILADTLRPVVLGVAEENAA